MSKRTKIININDGEGISFKNGQTFYLTCCDCNLTHKIEAEVTKTKATIFITRDNRRTAQKRRRQHE